jgi:signal transduction histidine kinase
VVILESIRLFSHLPENDLNLLRNAAQELTFPAGNCIFEEGDPGDGLYLVKSGQVEISALLENGQRQVFDRIPPGMVFGEMTVLNQAPRSARAKAEQETTVIFVPQTALAAVVKESPVLALMLAEEVSRRLREFNHQYLRQMLQAERLSLVGRFASSVVHDLKNPLSVITLAASIACSPKATQENRKLAEDNIRRQLGRVTNLVNDILEYTRGSCSAQDFPTVEYGSFIRSLAAEFHDELELRGVQLVIEGELPSVLLPLNEKRLLRAFFNLFSNAADEMSRGGKIYVRARAALDEVVTEIEDSGRGIAPEIIDRLFDAFVTFGKETGTGLGLSITRKIIEDHQGRIWACNSERGGAVFAFALPKQRRTPKEQATL